MDILERILGIILPVFIIVGVGYGYARRRGEQVRTDMLAINRVSIDVLMPLLIFTALAAKSFNIAHNTTLIFAGVAISLGSGAVAWPVARLFGYDVRSFLPPMMYNNCGNMGLPLAVLAFGATELGAAVALFMACNLVYFSIGIKLLESGHRSPRVAFWRFLANPVMTAMVTGLLFAIFHVSVPVPLFTAMKMLGDACIPLMLFSLGVRMCDISLRSWSIGVVGAIVCPVSGLLVAAVLDQLLPLSAGQRGQMYLFASLPPAVTCFMMAELCRRAPARRGAPRQGRHRKTAARHL
jgi:hypothetical protein